MSKKNWDNQPDAVTTGNVVFRANFDSRLVEVRKARADLYYVTIGNLWGSQTVECHDTDKVFEVLQIAARARGDAKRGLPEGVTLLANVGPAMVEETM